MATLVFPAPVGAHRSMFSAEKNAHLAKTQSSIRCVYGACWSAIEIIRYRDYLSYL